MAFFVLLTKSIFGARILKSKLENSIRGAGMKPEFSIEDLEAVKRKYLKSCLKFRRQIRVLKKKLQNGELSEDARIEIAWELEQKKERLMIHGTVVRLLKKELKERRIR